jgi:hypothetical protein
LNALFFVALLLYLIPAAFGLRSSPEHRRRFRFAAIVTLGTAIAIAVVAWSRSLVDTWGNGFVLEKLNHDQLTWQWTCALVRARARQSSVGPRVVMYQLGAAWEDDRNANHAKADWQFTTADARIKLKHLYPSIWLNRATSPIVF